MGSGEIGREGKIKGALGRRASFPHYFKALAHFFRLKRRLVVTWRIQASFSRCLTRRPDGQKPLRNAQAGLSFDIRGPPQRRGHRTQNGETCRSQRSASEWLAV